MTDHDLKAQLTIEALQAEIERLRAFIRVIASADDLEISQNLKMQAISELSETDDSQQRAEL
jgi:hypothetical protein